MYYLKLTSFFLNLYIMQMRFGNAQNQENRKQKNNL